MASTEIFTIRNNSTALCTYQPDPENPITILDCGNLMAFPAGDHEVFAVPTAATGANVPIKILITVETSASTGFPLTEPEPDPDGAEPPETDFATFKEYVQYLGLPYKDGDDSVVTAVEIVEDPLFYGKSAPFQNTNHGPSKQGGRPFKFQVNIIDLGITPERYKISGAQLSFIQNNAYDVKNSGMVVRDVLENRNIPLDLGVGRRLDGITGWQTMFSSTSRNNSGSTGSGGASTATDHLNFHLNEQMEKDVAFVVGNLLAHQVNEKQRWVLPRGFSFTWDSFGSYDKARHFMLREMMFLWKLKGDKTTRATYLVKGSEIVNDGSVYGWDIMNGYPSKGDENMGGLQGFVSDEEYERLTSNRAALIGMYFRFRVPKQNVISKRNMNIHNFRLIFDTVESPNSVLILPPPTRMIDYQEVGYRIG